MSLKTMSIKKPYLGTYSELRKMSVILFQRGWMSTLIAKFFFRGWIFVAVIKSIWCYLYFEQILSDRRFRAAVITATILATIYNKNKTYKCFNTLIRRKIFHFLVKLLVNVWGSCCGFWLVGCSVLVLLSIISWQIFL